MANSPTHRLSFRRRREKKTDYSKRLALVKGGKARLVVRKSNANIYVQVVEFSLKGDRTVSSASGHELPFFGWKGGLGNLPAAYLTGYLAGIRSKEKQAVLDIGMQRPAKGGRIFAALKGAVDSGMEIPLDESAFPTEERIQGAHVKDAPSTFSAYKKKGLDPKAVPENFKETKEKIESSKGKRATKEKGGK